MLSNKESCTYKATLGKPTGGNVSRAGVAKFALDAIETGNNIREVVTLFA